MDKSKKSRKQSRPTTQKVNKLDALSQLNLNASGVDIGSDALYVAVPPDRAEESVRCFDVFTPDLNELANWLVACKIDTVAMEATGIYWIALYDILEAKGMRVFLVNAQHAKNVAGRKTDVLDCQWLQQLHTYGLLRASFRPEREIRAIRTLARHREMLIQYRASHVQHMQKALRQMNLQLDLVLSDITGVTGMSILRDIADGNQDPKQLASYRDPACKHSQEEIEKALQGNYSAELIFTLKQALTLFDCYSEQIKACDLQLDKLYSELNQQRTEPLPELPKATPRQQLNAIMSKVPFDLRTQLYQMAGVDLTAIDGLGLITVQTILSEIGVDMSKWPSAKHFCSWLGLSPHDDISGGKVLRHKTKAVNSKANLAFRQAAQSAGNSRSPLGDFYRRIKAKYGAPTAVVATAHKLARTVYSMLKSKTPYQLPDSNQNNVQSKQAAIRNLQRKAIKLGLQLSPVPA